MTPSIQAVLLANKCALLASLRRVDSAVRGHAIAGPPPTRPARHADPIVTRSTAISSARLAREFAPGDWDALRRYRLRLESPLWPDDAGADDYRLAARLSSLHAKGAHAYRNDWSAEDQSLADRVMSRRVKP
jgi:hypothetical protein